jgi:hypothetical protein
LAPAHRRGYAAVARRYPKTSRKGEGLMKVYMGLYQALDGGDIEKTCKKSLGFRSPILAG